MSKNPNRVGFMNHVDSIRHMESDKDTFLKAARLDRHESKREPLKAADMFKLAAIIGIAAISCTALILGHMNGHFTEAMIGSGLLIFIAGLGALIAMSS